ncbi:ABA4-like family protein [Pseudonocardia acaciae]|uniref:ABA4-like family protein n=1 Tax=Pseudonocardia acaciae TaxID=551276 RepID=UPI00048B6C57|nr:ABA4-like family protein [Pseudonocardia acaciae]
MTELFDVTFYLAAPFWLLIILAPAWSGTRRVMSSPWVTVLPLAVYLIVALPHFGELWAVVSRPDLAELRAFLATPYGAAAIWAHLIAFDMFIGRWMYLQGRDLGIHPLIVSPILLLTIFLSPFGLLVFLVVRGVAAARARTVRAGVPA